MKIVLLMAAGPVRNGWSEERPKHLASIEGKPLICYTVEQLNAHGFDNVVVVTHNTAVKEVVPCFFDPAEKQWWTETLLSTRELWDEWTAVVNADTIYSDAAMDMLATEEGPVAFIGDRVHNEILVFTSKMQAYVANAATVATKEAERRKAEELTKRFKDSYSQGRHTMHFAFYRAIAGLPLEDLENRIYSPLVHRLLPPRDYTCDIDKTATYRKFLAKHKWARREK